ncbi:MAG TPA: MipA/OmpV family protein [Burkholderiaceae bacterium]|nr:MipA/OmpV family protein [Burkholderiaceae bacterium]
MPRTPYALIVALLLMAALPVPLRAQPLWEVGVGAAALSLPDYRGSDERHEYLLPFPYLVYRGERVRADREGLRARVFDSERFDLDFSFSGNFALRSRDNMARQGMPSLHPLLEAGPEVYYRLIGDRHSPWRLDARFATRFAYSIGDNRLTYRGIVASPYLRLDARNVAGTGFDVTGYAGLLYGDRRYHDYLYTVDPNFATASRPAFSASGGYAGSLAQIGAGRRFGNLWVGGFIRYDSLSGAVFEASPLVRSQRYATAGIAAAWVLGTSSKRAGFDD